MREVVKVQTVRLEQAMVTDRRWTVEEFETLLVRHPLMINLVCRLLWGGYDRSGQLAALFCVTKDQTYTDVENKGLSLTGIQEVGIVHPLHLSGGLESAWKKLLSNYEIVPPFPQLGREIYRLQTQPSLPTTLAPPLLTDHYQCPQLLRYFAEVDLCV